ncbi:hypothetical protein YC2023_083236 [Brassica napus]
MTGGRTRVRILRIPCKCRCMESITELISKSNQNLYRRYYRCLHAAQMKVHPSPKLSLKRYNSWSTKFECYKKKFMFSKQQQGVNVPKLGR